MITIFTDGSCKGNPGPGGWAYFRDYGDRTKENFGSEKLTTNNRMELSAVIMGLFDLPAGCDVKIVTDSTYVKQGMESWIKKWKVCGWKTSQNKAVKNYDLWVKLDELCSMHRVKWEWVRGHSGHPLNEYVDKLACQAAESLM